MVFAASALLSFQDAAALLSFQDDAALLSFQDDAALMSLEGWTQSDHFCLPSR
jgi:hypothetical protein